MRVLSVSQSVSQAFTQSPRPARQAMRDLTGHTAPSVESMFFGLAAAAVYALIGYWVAVVMRRIYPHIITHQPTHSPHSPHCPPRCVHLSALRCTALPDLALPSSDPAQAHPSHWSSHIDPRPFPAWLLVGLWPARSQSRQPVTAPAHTRIIKTTGRAQQIS